MKFGETLYQRSVPKWSAYNFKYNEIKHLIKNRTSAGVTVPVAVPTQGRSRWEDLDNHLFKLLEAEYDNVTLFLRSKQGEIERRLAHLEKQVHIMQRAVEENTLDRKPIIRARKYQQLVRDSEDIGDEVQNLARFAAVQKTAFRKILKKYRKWTGSTSLQTRLDVEVFSSKKLNTDFSDYLQQLAELTAILTEELAGPMLNGERRERSADRQSNRISASAKRSAISQINSAILRGSLSFDAAVMTVPYGEAAGSAFYWIHPDNLDEARALLLRHMRDGSTPSSPARKNSDDSLAARKRAVSFSSPSAAPTHMVFYDNGQRFVKDNSYARPSRVALSGHWSDDPQAVVSLAGLSPTSSGGTILMFDRKALGQALKRDSLFPNPSKQVASIQHYLIEHRDVKPLAEVRTHRSRYLGMTNSADVASWATLDAAITVAEVDLEDLGEPQAHSQAGDAFPYAVLHIRWEFARIPAVVRAFDESHLAERLHDFTLEGMAIHMAQKGLAPPPWQSLLEKDIRKVPIVPRLSRPGTANRTRISPSALVGTSSGPSSSEGRTDSVFSANNQGYSSVTSNEAGPSNESSTATEAKVDPSKAEPGKPRRKKRARIQLPEPDPTPTRYWNEFDDGDSDVNPDDGYAIYVDPNEPFFPGAETVSKAFEAISDSFNKGKTMIVSWWPINSARFGSAAERAPLLTTDEETVDEGEGEGDSSGSDTEGLAPSRHDPTKSAQASKRSSTSGYRPRQVLTSRQKALEQTLLLFYSGLIAVSYMLIIMAAILLGTGRRKASTQVHAGVVAGVIVAESCAIAAMALILMRKQRLSVVHWGLVGLFVAGVIVAGIALLAMTFASGKSAMDKSGLH